SSFSFLGSLSWLFSLSWLLSSLARPRSPGLACPFLHGVVPAKRDPALPIYRMFPPRNRGLRGAAPHPEPEVADDFAGGVASGQPGHASAGMGARPTQIEAGEGHAVGRMAEYRSGAVELVKGELAVENIAVGQAKTALKVKRGKHLTGEHARLEV